MAFKGFDDDAFSFFEELHEHNEKAFWEANRPRYESVVKEATTTLLAELETASGGAGVVDAAARRLDILEG